MAISFDSRLTIADSVLLQDVVGETMFLNTASEQYFGLDEIGSHMLRVLTSAESIASAYRILLDEYGVDSDRLRNELTDLIVKLADSGLVEVHNA